MNVQMPISDVLPEQSFPACNVLLLEQHSRGIADKVPQVLQPSQFHTLNSLADLSGLDLHSEKGLTPVLILSLDALLTDTLTILTELQNNMPMPVVVFVNEHVLECTEAAIKTGVCAYIVDRNEPCEDKLAVIVELAIQRFHQIQGLESELQQTKDKLNERKLIDRAKGIIMQQKKLTEQEAYAQLRKTAMNNGKTMGEISRRIINVFEMLD